MNDLLGIVALFFLVLMNGFFVAAEFALVSVRRTRIDQPSKPMISPEVVPIPTVKIRTPRS